MKHFLIFIITAFAFGFSARAQYITIPDPGFKDWLMMRYPGCFNASGQMDTTCSAILNETFIQPNGQISNWQGFQYFRNLQSVNFYDSYPNGLPPMPATLKSFSLDGPMQYNLSYLPSLPDGLTTLHCMNVGSLTTLASLPSSLVKLELIQCYGMQTLPALPSGLVDINLQMSAGIQTLPALPNSLVRLNCQTATQLQSLPALPPSLRYLNVTSCMLTSLPALPASLDSLYCSSNAITSLPSLPAQIDVVASGGNQLTAVPTLAGTTLKTLSVSSNQITSLPALPATLQTLEITNNQLTALPSLPVGMVNLNCTGNQLTSLPAIPASLTTLYYGNNAVPVFPLLPSTLRELYCYSNGISNIPVFPDSLRSLSCGGNQLTSLPDLPHFLNSFECAGNHLNSLPALPSTLTSLACAQNNITCMPVLPDGDPEDWNTFYISFDDIIECVPNLPTHFFMLSIMHSDGTNTPASTYPLCSATNNVNHCAAFPLMTGHVYYDNNNNGTHDVNEPYRANVKVELSDGSFTFTDNNGYYQIMVRDTGNYSLTCVAPVYFAPVPAAYNFHFVSFDTLLIKDFGFQGTASIDSLGISINPINAAARPGFPYPYSIHYENNGTTTLNPNVVINYDNTRLNYDSCSNASVVNTGSSLTLTETGFAPGMQKSFIGYFRVKPTAVIGDSLRSGAHISVPGNVAANDSDVVAIRGAYDPNDKSATPKLTPAQVAAGDYIYYTIRFQNTGTDTAFNIVVTDTLNNSLRPSTMEMIATSHPCITTVKDNKVSFEFVNILLPDSNVNQLKSHGYISFRIKPVNTLVVGNIVPNKAAIYFDYNSPVITNWATTTIAEPIVVPLKLISFTVSRGIGLNANVYWQTNDEVNVKDYTIEMSTNGRTFTAVALENAKGNQYNSYTKTVAILPDAILYFRLKMTDVDSRITYSNTAILRNEKANDAFSFLSNPVKDELNISLLDESLRNTVATIYTTQGVKVRTVLLQHDVENVNVKSLSAGTYYLVTEQGSRQFVVLK